LKFVKRRPSLANWSSRGVAAPRMIPPPLNPGSPPTEVVHEYQHDVGFAILSKSRKGTQADSERSKYDYFLHVF